MATTDYDDRLAFAVGFFASAIGTAIGLTYPGAGGMLNSGIAEFFNNTFDGKPMSAQDANFAIMNIVASGLFGAAMSFLPTPELNLVRAELNNLLIQSNITVWSNVVRGISNI